MCILPVSQCVCCVFFFVSADVQVIMPHVPWMLTFIESIGNDEDKTDGNIACSAGLLG